MTAQRGMFVCGLLVNVSSLFKTRQTLMKRRGQRSYETELFQIKGKKWKMVPKGVHDVKQ